MPPGANVYSRKGVPRKTTGSFNRATARRLAQQQKKKETNQRNYNNTRSGSPDLQPEQRNPTNFAGKVYGARAPAPTPADASPAAFTDPAATTGAPFPAATTDPVTVTSNTSSPTTTVPAPAAANVAAVPFPYVESKSNYEFSPLPSDSSPLQGKRVCHFDQVLPPPYPLVDHGDYTSFCETMDSADGLQGIEMYKGVMHQLRTFGKRNVVTHLGIQNPATTIQHLVRKKNLTKEEEEEEGDWIDGKEEDWSVSVEEDEDGSWIDDDDDNDDDDDDDEEEEEEEEEEEFSGNDTNTSDTTPFIPPGNNVSSGINGLFGITGLSGITAPVSPIVTTGTNWLNPPSNQGNYSMSNTTSSEDIDAYTNNTEDSENASKTKKTKPSKKPARGRRTTKRSKLPPSRIGTAQRKRQGKKKSPEDADEDEEYIPPAEVASKSQGTKKSPEDADEDEEYIPPVGVASKKGRKKDDSSDEEEANPTKKKKAKRCDIPTNWRESNSTPMGGRIAGSRPASSMQQFDRAVRNRLESTKIKAEKIWDMATSSVKYGDQEFNAGMPKAERKIRAAWPNVIYAPSIYTEQKANVNGEKTVKLFDTPEMHFACQNKEAAEILKSSIMAMKDETGADMVNLVFHENFDQFTDFVLPELRNSRAKKAAEKAAKEAAAKEAAAKEEEVAAEDNVDED